MKLDMKNDESIILFIKMLEHLDCLELFKTNIKSISPSNGKGNYYETEKEFLDKLRQTVPTDYFEIAGFINYGLVWSETPEGHEYWSKKNKDARELAKNGTLDKLLKEIRQQ